MATDFDSNQSRHARRWPMARRVERQARLLKRMMDRLDVDGAATARLDHGVGFAQARRLCLLCQNWCKCQEWLHDGGSGAPPSFCANGPYFDLVRSAVADVERHSRPA